MSDQGPRPTGLTPFELYVLDRLDHLTDEVGGIKGAARLAGALPGALACIIALLALMGFGR